jgi:hypothetical protein
MPMPDVTSGLRKEVATLPGMNEAKAIGRAPKGATEIAVAAKAPKKDELAAYGIASTPSSMSCGWLYVNAMRSAVR